MKFTTVLLGVDVMIKLPKLTAPSAKRAWTLNLVPYVTFQKSMYWVVLYEEASVKSPSVLPDAV